MTTETAWEIVRIVVSLLLGGGIGFRIGRTVNKNKSIRQSQKGGDNSNMMQIGEIRHG